MLPPAVCRSRARQDRHGLVRQASPCVATRAGLRLPPQAAQAEGLPEGADAPLNQSREAHLAARPLHSPEGGQSAAVFAADWPHEGGLTSTDALGQRSQGYAPPTRRE